MTNRSILTVPAWLPEPDFYAVRRFAALSLQPNRN
jgi:hypothetical protein